MYVREIAYEISQQPFLYIRALCILRIRVKRCINLYAELNVNGIAIEMARNIPKERRKSISTTFTKPKWFGHRDTFDIP